MSGTKKKIIMFLFVFSLAPVFMLVFHENADAAGGIVYEPMTTEYGIFNKYNFNDYNFYTYYTDASHPYFNTLPLFKSNGSSLEPGKRYERLMAKYTWDNFAYTVDEDTGERQMTTYGWMMDDHQLLVSVKGKFHNDAHHHHKEGTLFKGYDTVGYQRATLVFNRNVSNMIGGSSFADEGTSTKVIGGVSDKKVTDDKNDTIYVNKGTSYTEVYPFAFSADEVSSNLDLVFRVLSTNYPCDDGKVWVENLAVTFADVKNPRVYNYTFYDENWNKSYGFKAGQTFYLKLEFNEPIRFADNSADHGDIYIEMANANNYRIKGYLTELKENYLIFKFDKNDTTLSDLPAENRDIELTSIDLTNLFGERNWELNGILGQKAIREGQSLAQDFRSTVGDDGTVKYKYGYDYSRSLVTDIAGNPLEEMADPNNIDEDGNPVPLKNQVYTMHFAIHVGGKSPEVYSIESEAFTNNNNVKQALGKTNPSSRDWPDDSDTHAGPGDIIRFRIKFSEHILANGKYVKGALPGLKARLNVKDENGNYVELLAARVYTMDFVGNEAINFNLKDFKTEVTFQDFWVKEGYTYEDPQIKIKQIVVDEGLRITDLEGNEYDYTTDLIATGKNTNAIYVDVTGPAITITIEPSTEGTYKPIPEKYDETNREKVIQFCFPLQISKKYENAPNESDVDGIYGKFKLINGIENAFFKYEYAVTATPAPPEDDRIAEGPDDYGWHIGYSGTGFSDNYFTFRQIASGTYIHIRLIDDENYNIDSMTLRVVANDYAGASSEESFLLDYTVDGQEPSATAVNYSKVYDDAAKTGTITVNIKVTDSMSGLKEAYYMWVDQGANPPEADEAGWTLAGTFSEGTNEVVIPAVKRDIITYAGDLYVKAVDRFLNVSVTKAGTYAYSVEAPEYNLAYTENRTSEAELYISDISSGTAVAVLIKNPAVDDNSYFVSIIDDDSFSGGDVLDNSSFSSKGFGDVYSWQVYRVTTEDGSQYKFEYVGAPESLNFGENVWRYWKPLNDIINGQYYGELKVTLLAGSSPLDPSTFDVLDEDTVKVSDAFIYNIDAAHGCLLLAEAGGNAAPVYPQEITLKSAPGLESVYKVDITTTDVLDRLISYRRDKSVLMSGNSHGFDPDDDSDRMLSTLEGVRIKLNIQNILFNKWGIDDIDFQNSYVSVIRVTNERLTGYDGNTYATIKGLERKAEQTIALPAADYPSGRYKIELHLIAAASGKDYTFSFDNDGRIFVDGTKASEDFGFAGYSYSFSNTQYNIDVVTEKYYGPVYGVTDDNGDPLSGYPSGQLLRFPVNSREDGSLNSMWLYFTVDDMPEYPGETTYEIIGARAIKVWNETAGVDAAESRAKASWYYALDATNAYNSMFSFYIPKFVDSEDQVLAAYGDDGMYGYLPLIKNKMNTVAIQVINANGIASQVKYVYIEPIDAKVSGTLSITDTQKPVKEGKLAFKPSVYQSMDDVEAIYVYDGYAQKLVGNLKDNYDTYDNSYYMVLKDPGYHKYYVYAVDMFGNYKSGH